MPTKTIERYILQTLIALVHQGKRVSSQDCDSNTQVVARARKEAAAWMARLRRPKRYGSDASRFKRWLSQRPENLAAWQLAVEVWES